MSDERIKINLTGPTLTRQQVLEMVDQMNRHYRPPTNPPPGGRLDRIEARLAACEAFIAKAERSARRLRYVATRALAVAVWALSWAFCYAALRSAGVLPW